MDAFEGEPFLDLVPRRLVKSLSIAAIATLALFAPARVWFVDQAQRHVLHEIQPMIDHLIMQAQPVTPKASDTRP